MNNNDSLIRRALEKIKRDQKFKPDCTTIIGPTGPAGGPTGPTGPTGATGDIGPTGRFNNSSNKIIHSFQAKYF